MAKLEGLHRSQVDVGLLVGMNKDGMRKVGALLGQRVQGIWQKMGPSGQSSDSSLGSSSSPLLNMSNPQENSCPAVRVDCLSEDWDAQDPARQKSSKAGGSTEGSSLQRGPKAFGARGQQGIQARGQLERPSTLHLKDCLISQVLSPIPAPVKRPRDGEMSS